MKYFIKKNKFNLERFYLKEIIPPPKFHGEKFISSNYIENKSNIINVISNISLKAGENDRILVFYAGHGETMSLPDGGEMGYLLPVDGKQENLYASAIPMNDLKNLV